MVISPSFIAYLTMRNLLIFCIICVHFGVCFSCEYEYYNYLDCLQVKHRVRLAKLESEYKNSIRSQAKRCFRKTDSQAKQDGLCQGPPASAFQNRDPFVNKRGCQLCTMIGNGIKKNLLLGKKGARKCFYKRFIKINQLEGDKCLRRKLGPLGFNLKRYPDFEQGYEKIIDQLDKNAKYYMTVEKELDKCYDNQSMAKAKKTTKCWRSAKPMKKGMKQHCKIAKTCMKKVEPKCQKKVKKIAKEICKCTVEDRRRFSIQAQEIRSKLERKFKSPKECEKIIHKALQTEYMSWVDEIHHIVDQCPHPAKNLLEIPFLIKNACSGIVGYGDRFLSDMEDTVRMLGNFFQTMFARYYRFCPCDV